MVHIALFRENFQEIQQILVDLSPKTVVQDLAPLLLGNGVAAEQLDKLRGEPEALIEGLQLLQNLVLLVFAAGKLIQSLSVNASNLGHTLSPNSSIKRSMRPA